jgi:hypothetical protein
VAGAVPSKKKVPSDPIRGLAHHRHARCGQRGHGPPGNVRVGSPAAGLPTTASMPSNTPQRLRPVRDWLLAATFRSPATATSFERHHSGVEVPGLPLASTTNAPPARSVASSTTAAGLPQPPQLQCPKPVAGSSLAATGLNRRLHSPSGRIPQDQSVLRRTCRSAHLPDSPDRRSLPAALFCNDCRLRINACGSLRFRRLAVPQTSWNLLHYVPALGYSQMNSKFADGFSSR